MLNKMSQVIAHCNAISNRISKEEKKYLKMDEDRPIQIGIEASASTSDYIYLRIYEKQFKKNINNNNVNQ